MKDLRLKERFSIETNDIGVHFFDVYIKHKNVIYFIEGMSTVREDDFYLTLDEVYSGMDTEYQHTDKVLLGKLKSALYDKIHAL